MSDFGEGSAIWHERQYSARLGQRIAELEEMVADNVILCLKKLAAAQAREAKLREALEQAVSTCFDRRSYDEFRSRPDHFVNQALALPQDDTALKEVKEHEYRKGFVDGQLDMRSRAAKEALLEAANGLPSEEWLSPNWIDEYLRRMAEEMK